MCYCQQLSSTWDLGKIKKKRKLISLFYYVLSKLHGSQTRFTGMRVKFNISYIVVMKRPGTGLYVVTCGRCHTWRGEAEPCMKFTNQVSLK